MFFFRWDDDILHIFFESDKRTGFKKIISAISNEILDKLSCPWVLLHFVEYDKRFSDIESG